MRRRLVVAAALAICPVVQAASVQTVFSAENALYGAGYSIGQADGWIDDNLLAAVRKFQADRPGLNVTGELDSQTLAALGVPGNSSQLVGGNVVSGPEAARQQLGLKVAQAPQPVKAPAPQPEAAPKPAPEPVVAEAPQPKKPTTQASAPEPTTPEPVAEKKVAKTSEPVVSSTRESKPRPAPEKQITKAEVVPEPAPAKASSDSEPTSEPIRLAVNTRSGNNDESEPTVASVENLSRSDEVESVDSGASMPQESTPANADQADVSAGAGQESEPTERRGNVLTKMFDFLFGWLV